MGIMDIDRNRLDDEWCNQPKLFNAWQKKYAKAKLELDNAKTELEIIEAELTLLVKRDPIKYGLPENAAAGQIASAVKQTKRWQVWSRKINQLQYKVQLLSGTLKSLDQRRAGLERLVQLHGQDYFSVPKARTPEAKGAVDEMVAAKARKKTHRKSQKGRRRHIRS